MTVKRKLIEVALPLEAINAESAREKSIRHGHPSTLHLWWARRPLAACRAVLFAQLVDDPSAHPQQFPTEEAQQAERERLFRIIEELVRWENVTNKRVLEAARAEIRRSCDGDLPPVLDPFCGGGSIMLEAQRLGLEARGGDLNPVAVLITKALIEIPPRFAGRPPVNPDASRLGSWSGAQGLADDVRWYGNWMREQAQQRIGHLYPKVDLPREHGGAQATVIAWLWARTVTCPNPACGAEMPLVASWWLSRKKNRKTWIEPQVDHSANRVMFTVRVGDGEPPYPPKVGRGANFRCLACQQVAEDAHVKAEATAGRMGARQMAIVAEGNRQRIYVEPVEQHEAMAAAAQPEWAPEQELPHDPRNIWCVNYGLTRHRDLYTDRQLVALATFTDLLAEARELVRKHATEAGLVDDGVSLEEGGRGATACAEAVATYLALAVSRTTDYCSTICTWASNPQMEIIRGTFVRQALPMTWDFAESNVFGPSTGSLDILIEAVAKAVERVPARGAGRARQVDATASVNGIIHPVIATDPPYYDNIGYADLSDFFYVWLRRSLSETFPALFSTLLTPKSTELVASPYRFAGGKAEAESFFEAGLAKSFAAMRDAHRPGFPMTAFYAFKQAESSTEGVASTGWETMLRGLLDAGLAITGTWPMRTERSGRSISIGTGALASSIVLACRPRHIDAAVATRKEFIAALRAELPDALRRMQQGNIAPVDLAQASIGPGMAVFSRYAKVLEADGKLMPVRAALALINQVLDEVLAEQEGEFDADTRWAVAWFSQFGTASGDYGAAETLSKAKNTAVRGLEEAGIVAARGGRVRLLARDELDAAWDPGSDRRVTVWEVTQHLILRHEREGEQAAAALLRRVGGLGDAAHDLAYRLYAICERKGWASEALAYNALVTAWPETARLAATSAPQQTTLDT